MRHDDLPAACIFSSYFTSECNEQVFRVYVCVFVCLRVFCIDVVWCFMLKCVAVGVSNETNKTFT